MNTIKHFGDGIVGTWVCKCGFMISPEQLYELDKNKKARWTVSWEYCTTDLMNKKIYNVLIPLCPKCASALIYDETK